MSNDRARRGGGRATSLTVGYANLPAGGTYGNTGAGAQWFGPGQPMTPAAPKEVAGRAWDFPQGYNITTQTRAYEPISFTVLRAFADSYDLLRLVIETRKDEMSRLRWVIQPKDSKMKITPQVKNKVKAITKALRKPDGEHRWNAWLRMVLEDLFVIDAVSIYKRRTRGGALVSLDQIDGATIKRCLDDWGHTPEGKNETAYQQVLKGMPAVNYTKDDLIYAPRNIRVNKAYGFSPVEQILMTINIALRRQVYQLNFFTEGNIPAALIGVPETWTPDQIRVFQEWFDNILAGNLAEKRKARFVPSAVGKTYVPTQETELFGAAEEWLARVVCYAFSTSPLPFIKMTSRTGASEGAEAATATGLLPIQHYIKDLIDPILEEDLDGEDFEFVWRDDADIDPAVRQKINSGYLHDGGITLNEMRTDMGREPYDDKRFDEPMFMTSNGLAPIFTEDQLDSLGNDPTAAQGGAAALQGGTDPKAPAGKPAPGQKPVPGEPNKVPAGKPAPKPVAVSKMAVIDELVALGDVDLLAEFLRKVQLGTEPAEGANA